jgi:ABC-type uncharacterized transport system ATPase subunit
MTTKSKPGPSITINASTAVTSIFSGLILAGIIWVATSINNLQKGQIKLNDTMQELQSSFNRLNSKK